MDRQLGSRSDLHVIHREPTEAGPADGALAVLVHGSMDRASSFRRVMTRLPDFSIIGYDRRGYAGSAAREASTVFASQVDDLIEVLAGRTAIGVGHSLGGDVVLAAAQRHPELIDTAMVFEAPQPWQKWWPGDSGASIAMALLADNDGVATVDSDHAANVVSERAAQAAEAFMRRIAGDAVWERLPPSTRRQRRAEGPAFLAEMAAVASAPPPFDPAQVTIPVVCGYGSGSRPHQQEGARRLAAALPDAELVMLQGADHGAHLGQPAAFADLVRLALARRRRG